MRDAQQQPVRGANVVLQDEVSGLSFSTTATDGRFEFRFVSPGEYSLLVERFGYGAVQLRHVPVRASERLRLPVTLTPSTQPLLVVDSVASRQARSLEQRAAVDTRFARAGLERLPEPRRDLSGLARFTTQSEAGIGMQGLPSTLTGVTIDGVTASIFEGATTGAGILRTAAFPLSAFERVEWAAVNPDVEWGGHAGGTIQGTTRRGSRDFSTQVFGAWGVGRAGDSSDLGATSSTSLQGGFLLSGPVIRDTASFVVGVEAWRLPPLGQRTWAADSYTDQAVSVARDAFGVDLSARDTEARMSEAVSAFGRFDWRIGASSLLGVRANFASIPSTGASLGYPPEEFSRSYEGTDFWSSVTLSSPMGRRIGQEFRLGFESSGRTANELAPGDLFISTRILSPGLEFGSLRGGLQDLGQRVIRAADVISLSAGDHRVKGGISAEFRSYDYQYGAMEQFVFSSVEDFAERRGYFTRTSGGPNTASFSVPRAAVFLQDSWQAADGLDVLFGLRFDMERLPRDEAKSNAEWQEASGLVGTQLESSWSQLQPRFGFTWDPQLRHEWVLHGSAGLYSGVVDSGILGESLAQAGAVTVGRGFGLMDRWPEAPEASVVSPGGPTFTLLGPGVAAPRTLQLAGDLTRRLGEGTMVRWSAAYRDTDLLPRRTDLNLAPDPVARDQYGREIFGELGQQGGALVAAARSNRRFDAFDQVYAINADGWSRYYGTTLGIEHRAGEGIALYGSYTFSRTTDNWPAGGNGAWEAQLSPFPLETQKGGGWLEGRSDYDVPHRVAAGLELAAPALPGLRLATFYRYRSGYPFTPGFRDGVDANGDGSVRNDPAYVDNAVDGIGAVIGAWDCLDRQVGRFAERNSCRTKGVHSLDARLGFEVGRVGGYRAELVVDGLNLLGTGVAYPDRALYLVDRARPLSVDQGGKRVTVPLVANDNFGNTLVQLQSGRTVRIGIRVNY